MKISSKTEQVMHKIEQLERQIQNTRDFSGCDLKTTAYICTDIINKMKDILNNSVEHFFFTKDNKHMFAVSHIALDINTSDNIKIYPSLLNMVNEMSLIRDIPKESLIECVTLIELDEEGHLLVNKEHFLHEGNGSLINAIIGH